MGPARVVLLSVLAAALAAPAPASGGEAEDLEAARALFERHVEAIRQGDTDAYLACYLPSDKLVRAGTRGLLLGYEALAEAAGKSPFPDRFEALDLELAPIRPGVVFGTYRYRVRVGGREEAGRSERLFVATEDGWRIALTSGYAAPPGAPPPPRAFVGATLLDGTGSPPVTDAVVTVRDGRVECAGTREACPVPAGADVTDLAGFWITPGLVDAHVHLAATGWLDTFPGLADLGDEYPYPETVALLRSWPERWFRALLCSGVTAAFDVGGYSWLVEHRERAARSPLAPRLAVTGPPLATYDLGLELPAERHLVYLAREDDARAGVHYLKALGADAVKLWFVPGGRDFGELEPIVLALGEEAAAREIPVVAHAIGLREAKIALRAGARVLVHSVMDQPLDDETAGRIVDGGVVYVPTMALLRYIGALGAAFESGAAPAVEDPNGCVDRTTLRKIASTPQYRPGEAGPDLGTAISSESPRHMAANLRRLRDAGATIAVGTDSGGPLIVHGPSIYVEMEAMQEAGLAPMEVLVAATRGGAKAMGREDRIGTVTPGRFADLLVVAADPAADIRNLRQLRYVVLGGEMRALEELRARPGGEGSGAGTRIEISPGS